MTLNWGLFLDIKLFFEIMKKLGKVYDSHEYFPINIESFGAKTQKLWAKN